MRPVVVTQSGVGISQPVILDQYLTPEHTGWAAILTGSATYNVEFSEDSPYGGFNGAGDVQPYPNSFNQDANWFPLYGYSGVTSTKSDNTAYPVKALRINITSGTGSVRFTVNQAGIR